LVKRSQQLTQTDKGRSDGVTPAEMAQRNGKATRNTTSPPHQNAFPSCSDCLRCSTSSPNSLCSEV